MTETTNDGESRSWLEIELEDDLDEELEQAIDDARVPAERRALLVLRRESTLGRLNRPDG